MKSVHERAVGWSHPALPTSKPGSSVNIVCYVVIQRAGGWESAMIGTAGAARQPCRPGTRSLCEVSRGKARFKSGAQLGAVLPCETDGKVAPPPPEGHGRHHRRANSGRLRTPRRAPRTESRQRLKDGKRSLPQPVTIQSEARRTTDSARRLRLLLGHRSMGRSGCALAM